MLSEDDAHTAAAEYIDCEKEREQLRAENTQLNTIVENLRSENAALFVRLYRALKKNATHE